MTDSNSEYDIVCGTSEPSLSVFATVDMINREAFFRLSQNLPSRPTLQKAV